MDRGAPFECKSGLCHRCAPTPHLASQLACDMLSIQSDTACPPKFSFHVPCLAQERGVKRALPSIDLPQFALTPEQTLTSERNSSNLIQEQCFCLFSNCLKILVAYMWQYVGKTKVFNRLLIKQQLLM